MEAEEEKVRKTLDELFENAGSSKKREDLEEFKLTLDDYIDEGYKLREYIMKYNQLVQKILSSGL